jgi:chemotaxis response regulator CheB
MALAAFKSRPKRASLVRVIAIGASAGGIKGLLQLLPDLPVIPDCCLLIVVHLQPRVKSFLAAILGRSAHWGIKQAEQGEILRAGCAYVAPPDFHLLLSGGRLHLSSSEPVQMHRPSVDVLFHSLAQQQRFRTIGILLSGSGSDGSEGLRSMKLSGASTIVQDPADAMFPSMPEHGIETGCVDFIIPTRSIALKISTLCAQG